MPSRILWILLSSAWATLMYLAGIDLYDIMKVTGHAPPKMLKKYIKADSMEVVQKLTDKYG
ncbi:MAG: hypothetical protein IJS30_02530 [Bacteroidales bacterium]|nr:hypothetical protein [Bacteroidales bacterium]